MQFSTFTNAGCATPRRWSLLRFVDFPGVLHVLRFRKFYVRLSRQRDVLQHRGGVQPYGTPPRFCPAHRLCRPIPGFQAGEFVSRRPPSSLTIRPLDGTPRFRRIAAPVLPNAASLLTVRGLHALQWTISAIHFGRCPSAPPPLPLRISRACADHLVQMRRQSPA
jgi:hypothetical protein